MKLVSYNLKDYALKKNKPPKTKTRKAFKVHKHCMRIVKRTC